MTAEHDAFPRALSLAVHELRTPMTVLTGYLRMLIREQAGPINEKQRKMLEEAQHSCVRISALIDQMSELAKLELRELALERQRFDFAALVADVASGMHEGGDRNVRLELRGADRPMPVVGDRHRMTAAVSTLLRSALRERGEPGVVIALCQRVEAQKPLAVLAVGDEPDVRDLVEAATDAPGFVEEWRGGLGLGLPMARRVVEAHGGSLWSAGGERPRAGSAMRIPLAAEQV